MASLEPFVQKIKPAMDAYLRAPSMANLLILQKELEKFNWIQMKIFHSQILVPLILKLEEFNGNNQELQTGTMNCIRIVTSKLYLNDIMEVRTLLVIVLKQIRDSNSATTKANLSEEIKLVAVQCICEALRRSNTDVLELFYTKESVIILGQILLTLVEFIEKEKYRKLVISAIQCLMVVFYVHDEADTMDVVLRNQVADTIFIFLPKILTILFKTCLSDDKLGETLKSTAIRALGRILCVTFEETNDAVIKTTYDVEEFKKLVNASLERTKKNSSSDIDMFSDSKKSTEQLEERLKRMQGNGRSQEWFEATARKLRIIFVQTSILRSHESVRIRQEYAQMCCLLMQHCPHNLYGNFILLLENVVAMSEDAEARIRHLCQRTLQQLQKKCNNETRIFDENCELLFDEHLTKLPRIINRCDDDEQYAELIFLKGFLRNLSSAKIQMLLSMPKNLEIFCMCLISAVDLKISRNLLAEDYALHEMPGDGDTGGRGINDDFIECSKASWRQYNNLNSSRCIELIKDICSILGKTKHVNRIVFEFLMESIMEQNERMNEIILLLVWMSTAPDIACNVRFELVDILLDELLNDKHWFLALQADQVWRLKVDKPTNWFVDRTPGLYESAIEVRKQDCSDSDDENEMDSGALNSKNHVTIADAQFNVLHTCIVLDALGHCATFYGAAFDKFLFRCLHKVLLKVASNNSIIYQAANFALISMEKALKFAKTSHFIETYTDYISYHLNTILKRSPESRSAVDILTVVLQFSSRNALPHMESIFQTIRDECTKSYQSENIISYLKVFHAFLIHVSRWQVKCDQELDNIPMQMDNEPDTDIFVNWFNILNRPSIFDEETDEEKENNHNQEKIQKNKNVERTKYDTKRKQQTDTETERDTDINKSETESEPLQPEQDMEPEMNDDENNYAKPNLPRHIEMIKDILSQVVKFISSSEQMHQILSLECLISGLDLLKDYESELLPMVHLIWKPLVDKFRQKDAIVLNRCFTLLNTLATQAKDFILKRSLDDVIPYLKQFLREAAFHSASEKHLAQTQEYKLQLKLLQEFANLIQCMQIDGKHLNEILEAISLYLSREQPKDLQNHAVQFYVVLRSYNSPLVYLTVLKKAHLREYKENVLQVFEVFGIKVF